MKTNITYQCEYCLTEYKNRGDAAKCEAECSILTERGRKTVAELLSDNIVELGFSDLSELILNFPDKINTLMIQKTFNGYCVIADEVSISEEQKRRQLKDRF